MHPRSTHTPSELVRLEEDTGLHFAGFLFDDRCLLPVLVRPIHNQAAQRGIIEQLNDIHLVPYEEQELPFRGPVKVRAMSRQVALNKFRLR